MRVDPQRAEADILTELNASAERQYGAERVRDLQSQLQHLAHMMALVGERDLPIDRDAPDISGIPERSAR
jgi:hypothetical protein